MSQSDLLRPDTGDLGEEHYPDTLNIDNLELSLDYQYEPGSDAGRRDARRAHRGPGPNRSRTAGLAGARPARGKSPGADSLAAQSRCGLGLCPPPRPPDASCRCSASARATFTPPLPSALSQLGGIAVPSDAFRDDRLPTELRMNIRVTDAESRLLAAGRDLESIRRELRAQAAEPFSALDDPRWNRDGLTDWDFDELPAEVELPRGRLSVKAFPALLDRGDSVSLRLMDSPERAQYETGFGLRRLCILAAQRELATQLDWLPNLDKMQLFAATVPGFDLPTTACRTLGRPRHDRRASPCLRTESADFEQLLAGGRELIPWAVQELIALVATDLRGLSPDASGHRGVLSRDDPTAETGATGTCSASVVGDPPPFPMAGQAARATPKSP